MLGRDGNRAITSRTFTLAESDQALGTSFAFMGLIDPAADPARPPSVLLRGVALDTLRAIAGLDPGQSLSIMDESVTPPRVLIGEDATRRDSNWIPAQTVTSGDFRLSVAIAQPRSSGIPLIWLPIVTAGLLATFLWVSYRAADLNRREASFLGTRLSGTERELSTTLQRELTFFENSGTANCETDYKTGRLIRVNESMCRMFGYTRDELIGKSFPDITHPDDIAMSRSALVDAEGRPLERLQFEKRYLRKDGSVMWGLVNARLLFDAEGTPVSYSTIIIDITARKMDEETKSMLLRELAHRVRNTVQLTSSLARQTGRTARSVKDYESKFNRRLAALSGAQDLLFDTGWKAAPLREIARRTVKPFLPEQQGFSSFHINLPEIDLPTQQAQTLAIALHELTSNSAAFGALGHGGEIHLDGTLDHDETTNKTILSVKWSEKVSKRIRKPKKAGFGTIMLEQALPEQFGGTAKLNWSSSGLLYEARLPLP